MTIKEAAAEANRRMGMADEEITEGEAYADLMAPGGGEDQIEAGKEEVCIQMMIDLRVALETDTDLRESLLEYLLNRHRRN
jgi:hypothetical protein